MSVNKDCDYVLTDKAKELNEKGLSKLNDNDKILNTQLINEVNSMGYYILKRSDLSFLDKEDLVLVPIVQKYSLLFESKNVKNSLFTYLGFKGNTISLNFLISEFKKDNDAWDVRRPITWNFTRRWAISNAILLIENTDKIEEYIELVKDPKTHDDSRFIVELLGKCNSERAFSFVKTLLNDTNHDIQWAALYALSFYKNHQEIIEDIKPFVFSQKKYLAEQAKKTIKKLTNNN